MDQETIKKLKVGNKIVRVNIDFDKFEDGSTPMEEEWLTIKEINPNYNLFTCWNSKQRIAIRSAEDLKEYSKISEGAYEIALEKLKERLLETVEKITLCKMMLNEAKWIGVDYEGYANGQPVYNAFECSNCGEEYYTDDPRVLSNYCPNCGKRMRWKDEKYD